MSMDLAVDIWRAQCEKGGDWIRATWRWLLLNWRENENRVN